MQLLSDENGMWAVVVGFIIHHRREIEFEDGPGTQGCRISTKKSFTCNRRKNNTKYTIDVYLKLYKETDEMFSTLLYFNVFVFVVFCT